MRDHLIDRDRLLVALLAAGVDPVRSMNNLRFAVHEAVHAIHLYVDPPWTTRRIHEAIESCEIEVAIRSEVYARAVESHVFEDLDEPWDIQEWAAVSCMEWVQWRRGGPDLDFWIRAIHRARTEDEVVPLLYLALLELQEE